MLKRVITGGMPFLSLSPTASKFWRINAPKIFTDNRMPGLPPRQQCQRTEGNEAKSHLHKYQFRKFYGAHPRTPLGVPLQISLAFDFTHAYSVWATPLLQNVTLSLSIFAIICSWPFVNPVSYCCGCDYLLSCCMEWMVDSRPRCYILLYIYIHSYSQLLPVLDALFCRSLQFDSFL